MRNAPAPRFQPASRLRAGIAPRGALSSLLRLSSVPRLPSASALVAWIGRAAVDLEGSGRAAE